MLKSFLVGAALLLGVTVSNAQVGDQTEQALFRLAKLHALQEYCNYPVDEKEMEDLMIYIVFMNDARPSEIQTAVVMTQAASMASFKNGADMCNQLIAHEKGLK